MRTEVAFYGFVRDVVDTSTLLIETPEPISVRQLLELAAKRFGDGLRERLLNSSGELAPNVRIFVGEQPIDSLGELIDQHHDSSAAVRVFVLSATAGG